MDTVSSRGDVLDHGGGLVEREPDRQAGTGRRALPAHGSIRASCRSFRTSRQSLRLIYPDARRHQVLS
jgi:hypothetical protein